MNIWRYVLLWVVRNPIFYSLKSLGYKKYNVGKKFNLTINAFLWKKWLSEKEKKMYASTKKCVFQNLICIQAYATYANCWTLLTGSKIHLSNWFYNILRIMSFNKDYEVFSLAAFQFIHWLKLNFQQIDWSAVNFWL